MEIKISENTAKEWLNLLPIEYRVGINHSLIDRQKLNRAEIGKVFQMHGEKLKLFDEARSFLIELAESKDKKLKDTDLEKIKKFNHELELLEYNTQSAWKFERNADYHNWWLDMPGCRCPQIDNRERLGYAGAIYNGDCPWHGWFDTNKTEI